MSYQFLHKVNYPSELKKLSIKELNILRDEIREFLIDTISESGGHLSSNLGVIEATIALHYVFNSPFDKIIFDVGHQCYTHKILTGRLNDFKKFRTIDGLSGFPRYNESEHDVYETGHSSTSISAMCGFLEAKKQNNNAIGEVISFIGDGSLQSGLSLAGINYLASHKEQKGIIIINDNEMSISKNVGGLARYFSKVRIHKSFALLRKLTTVNFRMFFKSFVYRNVNLFGHLKYTYLGPIDGHDTKELIKFFEYAKNSKNSVVLHIKTTKGKGYHFAENDTTGKYHGIGAFNKQTGEVTKKYLENEISFSNACGIILENLFEKHKNLIIITPAMTYGMGLTNLSKKYPTRSIDVGIAEENAVVMASSLALSNIIPIVCTYATFFQRAYDQLLHDISRPNSHAIFLSDRAGVVNCDGDTHQGIFDISMISTLPNFVIASPSTMSELKDLLEIAIVEKKPFYIRYPKTTCLNILSANNTKFGKWKILKNIEQKNIITYGPKVIEFFNLLVEKKIGLINALFIKPIDLDILKKLKGKEVYIYEDSYLENSLSSKIIEFNYFHNLDLKIKKFGFTDFIGIGTDEEIRKKHKMDLESVILEIIGD